MGGGKGGREDATAASAGGRGCARGRSVRGDEACRVGLVRRRGVLHSGRSC